MKFKFDKNLGYQLDAIKSIVDIFDTGKNIISSKDGFELISTLDVFINELEIDEKRILSNVQSTQKLNKIDEISESLDSMDFSIEMETGTGKTYVYLRTIFELNKKYKLKKFIILVPSVAIREGVIKTLKQTKKHFHDMYGAGYDFFDYDSKKLSRVRNFARNQDIQIMVMTIQSFNSDNNILRQKDRDDFYGEMPMEIVSKVRPVIIMDEPQNMESELSKSAISDLKAIFKLRYSATHKNKLNLMYELSPASAYRKGLVKKIEVFGVKENDSSAFIFKVKKINAQKGKLPTAKVGLEVKNSNDEFIIKDVVLKMGDNLKRKTKNDKYEGLIVNEIDAKNNRAELSDGKFFNLEEQSNENKEAIFRTQIKETIKTHLGKQEDLGSNVKVLSLFFIDKVDNYVENEGIIKKIFVEEFEKLKTGYDNFKGVNADDIHRGYFACKKKKGGEVIYEDTSGKTKKDKETYDLIMKDKERLLSFDEPTCFIFSHSALKEGWDNPNVFQICTLNETRSASKKRQEIGRGMRLAVDINGDRIFDSNINRLTVIANESYKDFVGTLQSEYNEAGYKEIPEASNSREKIEVKFQKHLPVDSEDFKNLWSKIRKKTKFNIELKKEKLVKDSVEKINKLDISNLVVSVDKIIVDFESTGKLKTIYENSAIGEKIKGDIRIGNIIERIVKETGITKKTIFEIISLVDNLDIVFENYEEYVRSIIVVIKTSLNELLINEGLKYLPVDNIWEISIFEDINTYKSKTVKCDRSAYEKVVFDSNGEKEFAESLDANTRVKLFVKLPPKFIVDTPLGTYNPDWAIVMDTEDGEKLYLIRETKFVNDLKNLRLDEQQKILCGRKHFKAIGVDFEVSRKSDLSDLV